MLRSRTLARHRSGTASRWIWTAALLVSSAVVPTPAAAQEDSFDRAIENLRWRNIGPSRGGRVTAVAGIPGDPLVYYMGATGGGVWKTENAGQTWFNVSDNYFRTGSVGAIAIAPSDPNIVYVGMGESKIRGNFSHGDGVYKSVDGGRTWEHRGLEDTRQIGKVIVHPLDPDTVWVAAMGHVSGPNETRGVFQSTDGGASWTKVLYVDEYTGACDLSLDPGNPRVMFAAMWQVYRHPWTLESGGPGSGLYRSTDGGANWTRLESGLPRGTLGRIGVSVSPVDSDRVWAIVEAEDGGVFLSDDGGNSFRRTSEDRNLRQRAWYYTKIYADTQEIDTVYVLNVRFHRSKDGGRTFSTIGTPHGDNHDLWIAPENNQRMVEGNDGGACVTFDGGASWSSLNNQPTAQFYRVSVDNQFPYRVYGAQQDNSTVSISSRGGGRRGREEFYSVGGGESGHIAVRADDANIVFAGSYGGYLSRYDHSIRSSRNIMVWPENPMGWGAEGAPERFQWNFPIVLSPHDPNILYVCSQHVWRSDNEGETWRRLSPDLTTDDPSKQRSSGGPITKDNTGVEYYCTIFAFAESPLQPGLLWAGTDDGLVHVSRDGGESWTDVTPLDLPKWAQVNGIDLSVHDPGTARLAVTAYKLDDYTPYLFTTHDFGETWQLTTQGIDRQDFVRSVREDPVREGLVYAGTETSVYVSTDDGQHWRSLQQNLPHVPVTEMVVKDNDLVIATQGRSFWILGELDLLRQADAVAAGAAFHAFVPSPAIRGLGSANVRVFSDGSAGEVRVEVIDGDGDVVQETKSGRGRSASIDRGTRGGRFFGGPSVRLSLQDGIGSFSWDLRYPGAEDVPGAVMWGGSTRGPLAPPGEYTVRFHVGEDVHEVALEVRGNPLVNTTQEEYDAQFALLLQIRNKLSETNSAINRLRRVREQAQAMVAHSASLEGADEIRAAAKELEDAVGAVEEALIQTRSRSSQDPLNYPIKLNNKIAALAGTISSDYGPTEQHQKVYDALSAQIDEQLAVLEQILGEHVPAFNELVASKQVPAIVLDESSPN